jgi:hypothetical protein
VTSGISVTSGGGSSPSIGGASTFLFTVTEGATGSPAATLVLGMPAAPTDWGCSATDRTPTTPLAGLQQGAASTTAVTIKFGSAPSNGDVIQVVCNAR